MIVGFSARYLIPLLLLSVAGLPSPLYAGYKVLLKSGEEIYAEDYWLDKVDKNMIRLDVDGTPQRIARDGVLYISPIAETEQRARTAIKRISFEPKEKLSASSGEAGPDRTGETVADASATSAAEPLAPEPTPLDPLATEQMLREAAERIDREREAAKEAFKNSLAGSDLAQRQQARQKILDLTEERSRLLERARAANQGSLPAWWRWSGE